VRHRKRASASIADLAGAKLFGDVNGVTWRPGLLGATAAGRSLEPLMGMRSTGFIKSHPEALP
jgi:hypothetical protein